MTQQPPPPTSPDQTAREIGGSEAVCSLCGEIGSREYALWKGGELVSGAMPAAEAKLEVVGFPYVKADTSSGNACLRRCPACGAFFWWEFSYEYLVNGSEDEIVLTRLAPEDGRQREEALRAHIRAEEEAFRSRAAALAEAIRTDAALPAARDAAYDLLRAADRGFDLGPYLPALAAALCDHAHLPAFRCPVHTLETALSCWASTPERARAALAAIETAGVAGRTDAPPEVGSLSAWLRPKLTEHGSG